MQFIRKWVQGVVAVVRAEKEREWAKESNEPAPMDGKTEDGLLLCYAWEKKLIGAEDILRRVRLWQKEHDPQVAVDGEYGGLFYTVTTWRWVTMPFYGTAPDNTLRDRIRQIALEADAEIKAREHKAAQKALKGTKK